MTASFKTGITQLKGLEYLLIAFGLILIVFTCFGGSALAAQEGQEPGYCTDTHCVYDPGNESIYSVILDGLEVEVDNFQPDPNYSEDKYMLIALQEAILAAKEGNYAVGACLVNKTSGEVIERGHNRVFYPYFRSDLHAEMDVLNRYEDRVRSNVSQAGNLTLYVSVEPSPMGLSRIIVSGVKEAYYLTPNPEGGMVHMMDEMPPTWKALAAGSTYAPANCSQRLKSVGSRIFKSNSEAMDERLKG